VSRAHVDPETFYREWIPAQFNRGLAAQAAQGEVGKRVHAAMRAVSGTIRVDVEGQGTWFLNIREGQMSAGASASHAPFLTLIQDAAAFERIASEAGDSALALLGGLSGLAGEMKLTRARVEMLAEIDGLVLFEVSGPRGFALRTHFGPGPVPAAPATTIRMDEATYRDLRSGKLDPQTAFMTQQVVIEGDMRLAMLLALAAVAPD
jgi:hypothetical protein